MSPITTYTQRFKNEDGTLDLLTQEALHLPRRNEIKQLVDLVKLERNDRCLNFPYEGAYLDQMLSHTDLTRADFLLTKHLSDKKVIQTDYHLAQLADQSFNTVLSITPLHHFNAQQQRSLVRAVYRVLKNEGEVAIAEVGIDTPVALFLDRIVDQYSRTGHKGHYLSNDFYQHFENQGFINVVQRKYQYLFHFSSFEHFYEWTTHFFGLSGISMRELVDQAEMILGFEESSVGVDLRWGLDFIYAKVLKEGEK